MSFDDNGNPVNDVGHDNLAGQSEKMMEDQDKEAMLETKKTAATEEEPVCFINAAALDEPEEEPCSSSSLPSNNFVALENENLPVESQNSDEMSSLVKTATVKPKVPISKSYPDIIQTTLSLDEDSEDGPIEFLAPAKASSDKSDLEESLMIADSLEDLHDDRTITSSNMDDFDSSSDRVTTPSVKAFDKPLTYGTVNNPMILGNYRTADAITNSAIMTESTQSGIFSERPPEAWVVDLNSLSMDASSVAAMSKSTQSTSSSNHNSLAFFVDINELQEDDETVKNRSATPEKKIFSMFVDLEDEKSADTESTSKVMSTSLGSSSSSYTTGARKPSRLPVHKSVKNVLTNPASEENTSSNAEYAHRFPSPLSRHKMAADNARKCAQMEVKAARQMAKDEQNAMRKNTSKDRYSSALKTSSIASDGDGDQMARSDSSSVASKGILDVASNRSSLHVANVLDNSYCSSILGSMDASVLLGKFVVRNELWV